MERHSFVCYIFVSMFRCVRKTVFVINWNQKTKFRESVDQSSNR